MIQCVLQCPLGIQIALVVIFFFLIAKIYIKATTGVCKSKNRLDGKTVIITGGNSGIGKEAALDLASRGAKIILACRDITKANSAKDEIVRETGNKKIIVKKLDLNSLKSVRSFAANVLQSENRLDILINNAGCALIEEKLTVDGFECQMQSNHLGHFLLTNLLLGLMLKSGNGRIINVSSEAHRMCKQLNLSEDYFRRRPSTLLLYTYGVTKLFNILFTRELVNKLDNRSGQEGSFITVNSLHPGAIAATEFGRFMPTLFVKLTTFLASFILKTMKEGAQTTIHLAVADEVANTTGKYFCDCKVAKVSKLAQDDGLAKKLWEISERLVKLKSNEKHL